MSVVRFPHEKVEADEYHCSKHPNCKGPHLPVNHDSFCDMDEGCEHHWEPCEFCIPVEMKDMLMRESLKDCDDFYTGLDRFTAALANLHKPKS